MARASSARRWPGSVIGKFGTPVCFLINGLSYIAVIIGLLMMRLSPSTKHATQPRASAWSGLLYVLQHRRVRTILGLLGTVGDFRLVVRGVAAGVRARCFRAGRERLRRA